MANFIFDGRGKNERTGNERTAIRNIRGAINWIVGGYYNAVQDEMPEYLPQSRLSLEREIYDSAMNNLYGPGHEACGLAPREMRFAGEAFCRAYIAWALDNDDDVREIAQAANW